jgi:hypothetical protein
LPPAFDEDGICGQCIKWFHQLNLRDAIVSVISPIPPQGTAPTLRQAQRPPSLPQMGHKNFHKNCIRFVVPFGGHSTCEVPVG